MPDSCGCCSRPQLPELYPSRSAPYFPLHLCSHAYLPLRPLPISVSLALGQLMLFVDGMLGVVAHSETVQWLYTLCASLVSGFIQTHVPFLLGFLLSLSFPLLQSGWSKPEVPRKLNCFSKPRPRTRVFLCRPFSSDPAPGALPPPPGTNSLVQAPLMWIDFSPSPAWW